MKTALRIASVLTWFNLILWGLITALLFLGSLGMGLFLLVPAFILSSIPLNCYAALQLHKSIRNPTVKLSSQTPAGIRFIGFIALFFGILQVTNSIGILKDPAEMLRLTKESFSQVKGMDAYTMTTGLARTSAVISLVLGLAILVNVLLNFRLLRWYYLVRQSDAS